MNFNKEGKKYGLEIRSKKPARPLAADAKPAAIFGDVDDDEDDEDAPRGPMGRGVEKEIARQAEKKKSNKETEQAHASALAEDPNAFSYDEVFDEIHAKRDVGRRQEQVERKSKYIATLMEKAKQREQEKEIVFEKKLAKDRAKEQEEFGDKERFVTRAYREKLAERKKWLEEEKRREAVEAANDVTKREDLSDLYRNLFHARTGKGGAERGKGADGTIKASSVAEGSAASSPALGLEAGRALDDKPKHTEVEESRVPEQTDPVNRATPIPHTAKAVREDVEHQSVGKGSEVNSQEQGKVMAKIEEAPAGGSSDVQSQQQENPRVTTNTVSAARERYLSRKKQKVDD